MPGVRISIHARETNAEDALTDPSIFKAFLNDRQAELEITPPLFAGTTNREVTPFIRRLGWQEHVKGFSAEHLIDLLKLPTKDRADDVLRRYKGWVVQYLDEVQQCLQSIPNEYLLRLLNSESLDQ